MLHIEVTSEGLSDINDGPVKQRQVLKASTISCSQNELSEAQKSLAIIFKIVLKSSIKLVLKAKAGLCLTLILTLV